MRGIYWSDAGHSDKNADNNCCLHQTCAAENGSQIQETRGQYYDECSTMTGNKKGLLLK